MRTSTLIISLLTVSATARFGQEQLPIPPIRDVTSGGAPGVAATLAGSAISDLLGAANPCGKLVKADEIISKLGTGADAIAAAIGLVQAEQNFNPFAVDRPFVCGDPSLPQTEVLRGRTPLVDPEVEGSEVANALMVKSKTAPLENAGRSVAQIMADNGFNNLVAKDLAGNVVDITAAAGRGGAAPVVDEEPAEGPVVEEPVETVDTVTAVDPSSTPAACEAVTTFITVTRDAAASSTAAPVQTETPPIPIVGDDSNGSNDDEQPASGGNNKVADGVDFGACIPTMDFVGGRNGRKATEFTFLPTDKLVAKGQQEALNPNIITNRICDQLINVCEANKAAHDLCLDAKAEVLASGLRDASVVKTWNAALGFAGALPEAPAAVEPVVGGDADNNTGGGNAESGAADFGKCTPTMDFVGGRNGRKATEFTFLPTDDLVKQGQQEALNPNIITNRICDQLTNVCGANQAGKDLCLNAKAQVLASGLRDASVVNTWNSLLGFAGAVTPAPAPVEDNTDAPTAGDNGNNAGGAGNSNPSAADFGLCIPTMDFVGGRNGRKPSEFTFLPTDDLVAKGQQEALNPNIITNRICDQLTNVCEANQAAKDLCLDAKAKILADGKRDASVIDTWNGLLGF